MGSISSWLYTGLTICSLDAAGRRQREADGKGGAPFPADEERMETGHVTGPNTYKMKEQISRLKRIALNTELWPNIKSTTR